MKIHKYSLIIEYNLLTVYMCYISKTKPQQHFCNYIFTSLNIKSNVINELLHIITCKSTFFWW